MMKDWKFDQACLILMLVNYSLLKIYWVLQRLSVLFYNKMLIKIWSGVWENLKPFAV